MVDLKDIDIICPPCDVEDIILPNIEDVELLPLCPPCDIDIEDTFITPDPDYIEVVIKGQSQNTIINNFINNKRCRAI